MSLLSNLKHIGLEELSSLELYESPKPVVKKKKKTIDIEQQKKAFIFLSEEDFIFEKTYDCPVCKQEFKSPAVRLNKLEKKGLDINLRPQYLSFDPLKYDAVCCPKCGYAALTEYFDKLTIPQANLIRASISANFGGIEEKTVLLYDDAIMRHKLALGNAMVKRAHDSEKAYICLKIAWLMQGKIENFEMGSGLGFEQFVMLGEDEKTFLKSALDGFVKAKKSEIPPFCGMDAVTVNYLIAALAYQCREYGLSSKVINMILNGPLTKRGIKEMTLQLKEKVEEELKAGA